MEKGCHEAVFRRIGGYPTFKKKSPPLDHFSRRGYKCPMTRENEAYEKELKDALMHPSEEVHRVVLGSISDAVFITDDSGLFTYVCPNVENIFGYTFEEAVKVGSIAALLGEELPNSAEIKCRGELENLELSILDRFSRTHTLLVNIKRVSVGRGTTLYTCRDITERKQVEDELAKQNGELFRQVVEGRNQLRRLARREAAAIEKERAHLSRELHDEAGQHLTALKIMLKVAENRLSLGNGEVPEEVSEALKLADAVTDRVRRIAHGLRPPALDTVGLDATLAGLCRDMARRAGIPVDYSAEGLPEVSGDGAIIVYRVVQEALTNAVKHSQAKRINVRFQAAGEGYELTVHDDGVGFQPKESIASGRGLGLMGMRERVSSLGGKLSLDSSPGGPTFIRAAFPAAAFEEG